ncbi:MAG: methyltransferase domain-containing protein [Bradyrhizobium sp.]
MRTAEFYRAFEARHRGSRELIKKRLEAYLPFVLPLLQVCPQPLAVDLGCGRGEWLELLQEKGFLPQGVDLDAAMLEACHERGLPAVQGNAIAHLQSLEDASQCMVTGFHFAEHIAFDELQTVVAQAMRVLQPGGLLILETPNPENIVVGTTSFYLDPTHIRPIPPQLLSFLPELQGFVRVKVVRVQESPELATQADVGLMDVLVGVSPDYGVVAQKAADPAVLEIFDAAFATRFGVELGELVHRYDSTRNRRMAVFDQRLVNAEVQAAERADNLSRLDSLQERLITASERAAYAESQVAQLQAQLIKVEQNAQVVVGRVIAAESLATAHEQRAAAAEARAAQQEQRVNLAEARAAEQEQRAESAEARGAEQEQRAEAAEGRAAEYEQRAESAEVDAAEKGRRADAAAARAVTEEQRANLAERRAAEQEQRLRAAETSLSEQQELVEELFADSTHWRRRASVLASEREALCRSWSWRVTAPSRWAAAPLVRGFQYARRASNNLVYHSIDALKLPLAAAMRVVLRHPSLAQRINQRLMRYPALQQQLASLARRSDVIQGAAASVAPRPAPSNTDAPDLSHMTPRARDIYNDLKTKIESRQEGRG